jgi:hypothetical protein
MLGVTEILHSLEKHGVRNACIFIDACRDVPEKTIRFQGLKNPKTIVMKSLAPIGNDELRNYVMVSSSNVLVIFSCGEGERAIEDDMIQGSVFTH